MLSWVKQIPRSRQERIFFTQESTLAGHYTEKVARQAREAGYYIRLYYVGLDSPEESVRRIENRVRRGGHDIPADIVERRFRERWDNLAAVLPYCDEAVFLDNDNGFVEVAVYENGELLVKGDRRPAWLTELAAYLNG